MQASHLIPFAGLDRSLARRYGLLLAFYVVLACFFCCLTSFLFSRFILCGCNEVCASALAG
jgi:hypothetical protein